MQVVTGVMLTVLCCRAWRPHLSMVGPATSSPTINATSLLSYMPATSLFATAASANGINGGSNGVNGDANGSSVLFSTRSEGQQRDGFISIPLPSGLYAVTGDTLERCRYKSI